jgi:hypothetical protein
MLPLLLLLLLLLLLSILLLSIRVDVLVRCSQALLAFENRSDKGASSVDASVAAAAARRAFSSSFSLPGPAPSLAPFVVAGWLRDANSGPAARASLLFGGARQLLPSAADCRASDKKRGATPWLSGGAEVLPPPRGGGGAGGGGGGGGTGGGQTTLRVACTTHGRRARLWFRTVEARVEFFEEEEEEEEKGEKGGRRPLLLLRARADVAVLGVPRPLAGAARAAVEQVVRRVARDVSTELRLLSRTTETGW